MSGAPVHRCSACNTPIERGKLMCKHDWFTVPAPIRREVNDAWRALKKARTATECRAPLAAYRAAVERAVAAAREARP